MNIKGVLICSAINLLIAISFILHGIDQGKPFQYFDFSIAGLLFFSCLPIVSRSSASISITKMALYALSLLLIFYIFIVPVNWLSIIYCFILVVYFIGFRGYLAEKNWQYKI